MIPDDEKDYTFADKRGSAEPDGAQTAKEPTAESTNTTPETPGTETDEGHPEYHHLSPIDRMLMCIDILQQGAWIAMGLRAEPVTGELTPDMAHARLLVDSVEHLSNTIMSELDAPTRRDLKTLLSNLQVNFVRQKSRPQ